MKSAIHDIIHDEKLHMANFQLLSSFFFGIGLPCVLFIIICSWAWEEFTLEPAPVLLQEKTQWATISMHCFLATSLNDTVFFISTVRTHLITLVSWNYLKSFSTISIICVDLRQWHLSITDISDASVSNLGSPVLSSFSSVSTFPRALGLFWSGLPYRMAVIAIYPTNYASP